MDIRRRAITAVVALSLVFCLTGCIRPAQVDSPLQSVSPLHSPAARDVYLPIIGAINDGDATCFNNDKASTFYKLLRDDSRQQRTAMHCNQQLTQAAEMRVARIAGQIVPTHCDSLGRCPNDYAITAGCALVYAAGRNDIESLVGGVGLPHEAIAALLRSERHADHLLGRKPFYAAQDEIGVAYLESPGSTFRYYYVFLSAANC